MLPYQIRKAIERNDPAALPLGVVEYHAEHLPLGVDCFTCINALERIEKRRPELVVLPPFYYGSASLAVAAPEGNGTVHVDSLHLIPVAEDIFRGLLRSFSSGWKRRAARAGGERSSTALTIPATTIRSHGFRFIRSALRLRQRRASKGIMRDCWRPVKPWLSCRNVSNLTGSTVRSGMRAPAERQRRNTERRRLKRRRMIWSNCFSRNENGL